MAVIDADPLVVVHVPKTAGTSLRLALRQAYGDRLIEDYGDRPLTRPRWSRRIAAVLSGWGGAPRLSAGHCAFGHFLAIKYRRCDAARFAIWTREPVDRVLSRYAHYLRDAAAGDTAHEARGLRPGLEIDAFLALPNYRNTLAEYLWGFPLDRLDFVGSTEHFDEDLARFSRRFLSGRELPPMRVNRSDPDAGPDRRDPAVRARVRAANARDVILHDRLLAIRASQIARGQ